MNSPDLHAGIFSCIVVGSILGTHEVFGTLREGVEIIFVDKEDQYK